MNGAVQLIKLSKVPHAHWSIASDYKVDIIFIMSLPYFKLYLYLVFVASSFQWYLDLLITILPPLELPLTSVSSSDSVCLSQAHNHVTTSVQIHTHSLPQQDFSLNNWQSLISYRMMEICMYSFLFICCLMAFFLLPWDQSHIFLSLFAIHRFYTYCLNLKIMGLLSFFNLYWLLSFKHLFSPKINL